ncbi:MAG: hypothetical protein R3F30_16180 [Planctomycetota bacterium]
MIKPALTLALAFFLVPQGNGYQAYGDYDLSAVIKPKQVEGGETEYRVDLALVIKVMEDLASHARDYPTRFQGVDEKARAIRDARILGHLFDVIAAKDDAKTEVLFMAARLRSMAHNLDVEGASDKAIEAYERLLKREPKHPQGNWYYGMFLGSTATMQNKAFPYLEQAYDLGIEEAGFSLGVLHLMFSIRYLEGYLAHHPKDERTRRLLEAARSGKATVQRKQ